MRTRIALMALIGMLVMVACENSETTGVLTPEQGIGHSKTSATSVSNANAQLAAMHELQSAFHGAIRDEDDDLLRSLWTEDATFTAGIGSAEGPEAIADLIASSPVYGLASLAPSYKTRFEIHGNTAGFAFECVLVPEAGNLTGEEVVAHVNATGVMRKVGDRWAFESFVGGVGPLP